MSSLRRLIRNLKTPFSWKEQEEHPLYRTKSICIGTDSPQKLSRVFPSRITVTVRMIGVKAGRNVQVRTDDIQTGNSVSVSLYDRSLLDPGMGVIYESLGYDGVQLVCESVAMKYTDRVNACVLEEKIKPGDILYTKRFPVLETGVYARQIKVIQGVTGIIPIDGHQTGWKACVDLIPYGGRFVSGIDPEEIQAYFAQVQIRPGTTKILLSHAAFWQSRGINPERGGFLSGKEIHFSQKLPLHACQALGADIRQGIVRLPVYVGEIFVGSYVSQDYTCVNRSEGILNVEFVI
ncbi:MAG: hypothetical protein H6849_00155 [Alphaproteobacteria bacterium]|nr:MAG: hypothetical protein H6849_00155 [Alphaproteobacteria bacterium]